MADYSSPQSDDFAGNANYEQRLWHMYLSEQGACPWNHVEKGIPC